ncbi:uncharacterized protein NMK_0644 [Novimethylophilus kurashikiensis]|uniref:DUF2721 domain-containing protein n=1 Tax=Novimethylophilus kurashikiensis TaxID=1825523 RepID=A0A2R5F3Q9_9PROT|nr:uncharacterized protein NMK_0644 [Novimethylophilus kurashikiensis]
MVENVTQLTSVAHVIQLAVAPVFLLTGVGSILAVLSNRLARIVDRYRALNNASEAVRQAHDVEMSVLMRRSKWVNRAITLCTCSALLICIVIAALFVGAQMSVDPSNAVSLLFISAMVALISGLLCFLREIFLATGSIIVQSRR